MIHSRCECFIIFYIINLFLLFLCFCLCVCVVCQGNSLVLYVIFKSTQIHKQKTQKHKTKTQTQKKNKKIFALHSIPLSFYIDICKDVYGKQMAGGPRINFTNAFYGGNKPYGWVSVSVYVSVNVCMWVCVIWSCRSRESCDRFIIIIFYLLFLKAPRVSSLSTVWRQKKILKANFFLYLSLKTRQNKQKKILGNIDPWSSLSVLKDLTPSLTAIVVDGGAHWCGRRFASCRR